MLEENRETTTQRETPEEVVAWYVPRGEAPREVVDCYVQRQPLPRRAPEAPKRRGRRGLWIFLGCLALVLAAASLGWLIQRRTTPVVPVYPEDGVSSIIHIYDGVETTIPRYDASGENVRLTVSDEAGEEMTPQDIYAAVAPATAVVVSTQGESSFLGTGVVMTEDGYVITNAHVIAGGDACYVAPYGWPFFEAYLVGVDDESDIAVLKAMDAARLPAARFGNSDLCRVGDTVYAIGNPLGVELRGTMTDGMLSAINRDILVDGRTFTVLQTTAALNNGNSGGPLINSAGEVIGINTLKMSNDWLRKEEATVEGLGFALPISEVSYVVNEILDTGRYTGKPTFGISVITAQEEDGSFVVVYEVTPDGAAGRAGVRAGDVILAVDDRAVSTTVELLAIRRTLRAGETVLLTLLRGGETLTMAVTPEARR